MTAKQAPLYAVWQTLDWQTREFGWWARFAQYQVGPFDALRAALDALEEA